MSFALGQPVPLSTSVYDASGLADDATTATLTITLPDGTTVTPSVTHPAVGSYRVDYTATQVGLHAVRWIFGGVNAAAPHVDAFYVESASLPPLVSLAEVQQQCRTSTTAMTPILQRMMLAASSLCEHNTRVWRRQTLSATRDGGNGFVRLQAPVISVTTVTEDGIAVDSSGWILDSERGWLRRGTSMLQLCWAPGRQNIVITYVAGAAGGVVPPDVRQGVLMLVEHMWNTQRGGTGLPRVGDADWTLPPGFTIPNAVLELWSDSMEVLIA